MFWALLIATILAIRKYIEREKDDKEKPE